MRRIRGPALFAGMIVAIGVAAPVAVKAVNTGADPSKSVASDNLTLLDQNWGCHSYRAGRTPVAWEQRFHFLGGAGDDRVGYWMRVGKAPGPVTATGEVAGLCAVAPTAAQLGEG